LRPLLFRVRTGFRHVAGTGSGGARLWKRSDVACARLRLRRIACRSLIVATDVQPHHAEQQQAGAERDAGNFQAAVRQRREIVIAVWGTLCRHGLDRIGQADSCTADVSHAAENGGSGDNCRHPSVHSAASMLDPALLRQQPTELAERLRATRGYDLDVAGFEALEADRKRIQVRTQELQSLRNSRSKAIGHAKAKGEDVSAIMAEVAAFADELKASEIQLDELREKIEAFSLG